MPDDPNEPLAADGDGVLAGVEAPTPDEIAAIQALPEDQVQAIIDKDIGAADEWKAARG